MHLYWLELHSLYKTDFDFMHDYEKLSWKNTSPLVQLRQEKSFIRLFVLTPKQNSWFIFLRRLFTEGLLCCCPGLCQSDCLIYCCL